MFGIKGRHLCQKAGASRRGFLIACFRPTRLRTLELPLTHMLLDYTPVDMDTTRYCVCTSFFCLLHIVHEFSSIPNLGCELLRLMTKLEVTLTKSLASGSWHVVRDIAMVSRRLKQVLVGAGVTAGVVFVGSFGSPGTVAFSSTKGVNESTLLKR